MTDRRAEVNSGEYDERLRTVETWAATHEEKCNGRHKALDLRFDGVDDAVERVRREATAGRAEAAAAAEIARGAAVAAAIGRATILTWLKAAVGSVGALVATQIPWVQLALHIGHLLP